MYKKLIAMANYLAGKDLYKEARAVKKLAVDLSGPTNPPAPERVMGPPVDLSGPTNPPAPERVMGPPVDLSGPTNPPAPERVAKPNARGIGADEYRRLSDMYFSFNTEAPPSLDAMIAEVQKRQDEIAAAVARNSAPREKPKGKGKGIFNRIKGMMGLVDDPKTRKAAESLLQLGFEKEAEKILADYLRK